MSVQTQDPGDEPFLKILRPLVETYSAVMRKDAQHIRTLGLTSSQFDVIATLGDTNGMTCKQLSEATLVTKGTLTGVLDRLEKKRLIEREPSREDRRSIFIRLTAGGEACFQQVFPDHIHYLKPFFDGALTAPEMAALRTLLLKLKQGFQDSTEGEKR